MKLWDIIKKYSIDIIFIIILIYYLINCISFSVINSNYYFLIYIIPIFFIYYIVSKIPNHVLEKNEKYVKLIILIGSLTIYGIWNSFMRTTPVSDYEILVKGALEMAKGNISKLTFDPTNYFYYFNFQIGFISYLAFVMKIMGTRLVFLKLSEILIMSLSNVLVYSIISKISSKKTALLSSVVYSSLLFNIVGSSIINNQHISMLFTLLSLYFYLKEDSKISSIICGICLGLSYIFRPSSIIILIAFLCIFILNTIRENLKVEKKKIVCLFLIIISFLAFTRIYDFTMHSLKVVPKSAIKINAKYYKFVTGIQVSGITGKETLDASKTQIYYDIKYYNFDYDKYNKATKEYILKQYKNNTKKVMNFIWNHKMPYFTGQPDNQIGFSITEYIKPSLHKIIVDFGYSQYVLILFFSLIYSLLLLKRKKTEDNNRTLFKIIFIGFFLCHIPIEAQTRYRYDQYLLLCIISIPMFEHIFLKLCVEKASKSKTKKHALKKQNKS